MTAAEWPVIAATMAALATVLFAISAAVAAESGDVEAVRLSFTGVAINAVLLGSLALAVRR